jgi:predicted GTPase
MIRSLTVWFEFNLVDTAGIRRKAKSKGRFKFYSVATFCGTMLDICILVIDATRVDLKVKTKVFFG